VLFGAAHYLNSEINQGRNYENIRRINCGYPGWKVLILKQLKFRLNQKKRGGNQNRLFEPKNQNL
jgi:hypothetical protein